MYRAMLVGKEVGNMPSRAEGIVSMSVLVEADLRHAMRMALARDGLTFTEWVTAAMRLYLAGGPQEHPSHSPTGH